MPPYLHMACKGHLHLCCTCSFQSKLQSINMYKTLNTNLLVMIVRSIAVQSDSDRLMVSGTENGGTNTLNGCCGISN